MTKEQALKLYELDKKSMALIKKLKKVLAERDKLLKTIK